MLRRNAATTHTKAQIHMLTQCAHNVHSCGVCTHVSRRRFFFVFSWFFTWKKRRGNHPPLGPNVQIRRFATMPMATAGKLWPAGGARLGIPARLKKSWDRLGYPIFWRDLLGKAIWQHWCWHSWHPNVGEVDMFSPSWVPQSTSTHQGHQCHKWWFGDGLWHWV
jgi:hypothetical protein